jgi:PAS domain S-box-containing protein
MKRLFHSLSNTGDGAFVIDKHHRIIFWNQAAEEILQYSAEEAIGRSCYEILGGRDEHGNTLCQRYCLVAIGIKRGDVVPNMDVKVRTKTGEVRWLNVTTFAYPVKDDATGRVIVHLYRDATKRKNHQHFVKQVLSASEQLLQDEEPQSIPSIHKEPQEGRLTAREWQVLKQLAHGLDTNGIANTLTISQSTVGNHVQNILVKLGVHSRLEAIAYAYQNGLIDSNGS